MNLLSRIKKIELTLLDVPAGAVLLREPPIDADTNTCASFDLELREALESSRKVIVRRNGGNRLLRSDVEHCEDDISAMLALAAGTPDIDHSDRLSAILFGCRNTSLPVVKEVEYGEV